MEHLERLIRLQDQRLLLIERQFEADLKVLVDEFDDERDEVTGTTRGGTTSLASPPAHGKNAPGAALAPRRNKRGRLF